MSVGFAGIGTMGSAIAANLLRAGVPLVVWNRSPHRCEPLLALGARAAGSFEALCDGCSTVLLMLIDDAALDAVIGRGSTTFAGRVRGRTFVQLGTVSARYSRGLERDLLAAGARYVEAPVSGSRGPAERGELVAMLAGADAAAIDAVASLLAPACRRIVRCGPVPHASQLKLAVNHYLVATVAALAEAVHVARCAGIDFTLLREALDAGPMASAVSRAKLDLFARGDAAPQAAVRDVATIVALVAAQAREAGAGAPLIDTCATLWRRALEAGLGDRDMIAVAEVFGRVPHA